MRVWLGMGQFQLEMEDDCDFTKDKAEQMIRLLTAEALSWVEAGVVTIVTGEEEAIPEEEES